MKVKLYMPIAGSIVVSVDGEEYFTALGNLVERPVEFEFPVPRILEADEPPVMTGLITLGSTVSNEVK